ncbi:MAG: hypothetical protein KGJ06_07370 [Pseudomonadota bacterium]|nr:hypothetical protein [Pseudomonadota bacterium]
MDDKTFIASFAAQETQRISERLKSMVERPVPPSEEEKNRVIQDIETTLRRLQSALSHLTPEMLEEEKHEQPS